MRYLCLLLHSLLVALHAILLAIHPSHLEHRLTADLGTQTKALAITTTTIAQLIGTGFTTALVLLTQQLALRRDLQQQQTCTALHDKTTSWLGLGSSLLTLCRQTYVKSALWSVSIITLYLAAIFTIHITTSSVLSVVTFNDTRPSVLATQIGNPNQSIAVYPTSVLSKAYDILRVLSVYDGFSTRGLINNTIFDSPSSLGGEGPMLANATRIVSSCGTLPDAKQIEFVVSGTDPRDLATRDTVLFAQENYTQTAYYRMQLHASLPTVTIPAIRTILIYPPLVRAEFRFPADGYWRVAALGNMNNPVEISTGVTSVGSWNTILIISTVPVLDSSGDDAPSIVMNTTFSGYPDNTVLPNQVRVIACDISGVHEAFNVSTSTGLPLKDIPDADSMHETWHSWEHPEPKDTDGPFAAYVGNWVFASADVADWVPQCYWRLGPLGVTFQETIPELYLNATLSKFTDIPSSSPEVTANISMPLLQKSIESTVAAALWYLGKAAPAENTDFRSSGDMIAHFIVQRSQLNLNLTPLITGLVVSCLLLVLSTAMIFGQEKLENTLHGTIDSPGLLQLTWLLSRSPRVMDRFIGIGQPDTHCLRKAGMFEVNLSRIDMDDRSQKHLPDDV